MTSVLLQAVNPSVELNPNRRTCIIALQLKTHAPELWAKRPRGSKGPRYSRFSNAGQASICPTNSCNGRLRTAGCNHFYHRAGIRRTKRTGSHNPQATTTHDRGPNNDRIVRLRRRFLVVFIRRVVYWLNETGRLAINWQNRRSIRLGQVRACSREWPAP